MHTLRRTAAVAALALAVALVGSACIGTPGAQRSVELANSERSARGLPGLRADGTLTAKAQAWAERMAAEWSVRHSVLTDGVGPGWSRLGENVARAANVDQAHGLFMASPSHRAAILGGGYHSVGVGVAERNGQVFVAQVFAG